VTLWLVHLISIPISNTSVNPARSLAVAPFAPISRPLHQVWAFIVFPLIGGIVGAIVFRVVNLEGAGAAAVPDVEGTLKEGAVVEAPAEA
jgi:aquaporin Z